MTKFTINHTTKYSFFKHLDENREIDKNNLKKIKRSIEKEGQLQPIAVTRDGYIYDGQHRFMALRALGLPIWYYVNHHAEPQHLLTVNQVRKGHNIRNVVWYFANTGNRDCARLLELEDQWKEYGFSQGVIYTAFSNARGRSYQDAIRNNEYKVNEKFGVRFLNTLLLLHDKGGLKNAKSNTFARALKRIIIDNENFTTDRLLEKLQLVPLRPYTKEVDLRKEIVDVYNYKRRKEKISL